METVYGLARSLLEIEVGMGSYTAYSMANAQRGKSQQIATHSAFDTQVQRAESQERIVEEANYQSSGRTVLAAHFQVCSC